MCGCQVWDMCASSSSRSTACSRDMMLMEI
jgi:hypothetical protein